MKEITDSVDPRIMFKHQSLMQDYHELRKEREFKMRKLEMMKQRRSTLDAEVRFLKRRYKQLKQDQTLDTSSPGMLRLSESGYSKVPSKRKKNSTMDEKEALSLDKKNPKRSRGNEVLTNSIPLPDLNGDGSTFKVPGFDLNQISREEEEPEASGGQVIAQATKKAMLGNGNDDVHCEMKLPICRDVEKELNRAAVKRKVSWQDPVALSV
ncbi:unnamed protein product [Eruca vesicaria subsp. sativa]|uniref:Uncharacterized protein n=1 Tax=Eruca vesicaria subsp. sativa TaxID=29727 RepID=A0ABC8K2R2_ERUVS|nr:unnamed protein product [Eruca vesicaria subsp. sativa]